VPRAARAASDRRSDLISSSCRATFDFRARHSSLKLRARLKGRKRFGMEGNSSSGPAELSTDEGMNYGSAGCRRAAPRRGALAGNQEGSRASPGFEP
jgi:hypothetical protein